MSLKVENLEKNMAKLTITVAADDFTKAIKKRTCYTGYGRKALWFRCIT